MPPLLECKSVQPAIGRPARHDAGRERSRRRGVAWLTYRSVTPEIAGSNPVASAIRMRTCAAPRPAALFCCLNGASRFVWGFFWGAEPQPAPVPEPEPNFGFGFGFEPNRLDGVQRRAPKRVVRRQVGNDRRGR